MKRHEHAFTDVDAEPDPAAWIEVLDKVRQEPAYSAYKRRLLDLLDPQPGGRYIDVGAGTGADALACAARFGVGVTGVDSSRAMVEEARRRGLADAVVADAHVLPFEANSFDGAWADRTFQHLADPVAALGELVRVVTPGGHIVVADPDYGTQVVDIPDQELAQRVLRYRSDVGIRNGRLAHQMGRLFVQAGLTDVQVETVPVVLRDPNALDSAMGLRDWATFARDHGLIAAAEVSAWELALDQAAANGWFLYSFAVFLTAGRKSLTASQTE
jgi:SAM-dependent methyltransferase